MSLDVLDQWFKVVLHSIRWLKKHYNVTSLTDIRTLLLFCIYNICIEYTELYITNCNITFLLLQILQFSEKSVNV